MTGIGGSLNKVRTDHSVLCKVGTRALHIDGCHVTRSLLVTAGSALKIRNGQREETADQIFVHHFDPELSFGFQT